VSENSRAILSDVFVEQDARLGIAQQPRQCGFAVEEREVAQIITIVLDQVEGVEDCGPRGLSPAQLIEPRQTVGAEYDRLSIDRETLGGDPRCRNRDRRKRTAQS